MTSTITAVTVQRNDRKNMQSREAQQAKQVRDAYRAEASRIRANTQLNDRGRAQQLSDLHTSAKAQLAELRKSETTNLRTRRDTLQAKLFGSLKGQSGAGLIAYRDAMDRAAALTKPEQASALLRQALLNDDEQLAAAIARHAADKDWAEPFNEWMDTRPDSQPVLAELADIDSYIEGADSIHASLSDWSLPTPTEVRAMAPGDLHSDRPTTVQGDYHARLGLVAS